MIKDRSANMRTVPLDGVATSQLREVVILHKPTNYNLSSDILDCSYEGSTARSIAIVRCDKDYQEFINRQDTELLVLPTDVKSRREILAEWATKAAKKNKRGLIPLMLLPLAACNVGGGVTTTPNPFSVAEDDNTAGKWVITPADGGSVTSRRAAATTRSPQVPARLKQLRSRVWGNCLSLLGLLARRSRLWKLWMGLSRSPDRATLRCRRWREIWTRPLRGHDVWDEDCRRLRCRGYC